MVFRELVKSGELVWTSMVPSPSDTNELVWFSGSWSSPRADLARTLAWSGELVWSAVVPSPSDTTEIVWSEKLVWSVIAPSYFIKKSSGSYLGPRRTVPEP